MPTMTTATGYAPTGTTDSVADLLLRVRHEDPAAWDELLRRYGKLITTTVRSFRLQDADALDAVQMTWLRLAENAHRVQFPEKLGGWLATTARRECLHILRQTKRAPALTNTTPETVADPAAGPEQHVIDADTARTLRKLVDELSPRQQTLLRALFTDNPRPYAEVARTAGIPPAASGPPGRGPCSTYATSSTNTSWDRKPSDDDRKRLSPVGELSAPFPCPETVSP